MWGAGVPPVRGWQPRQAAKNDAVRRHCEPQRLVRIVNTGEEKVCRRSLSTIPILAAELVGFISEYQKDYDLMRVTSANLIRENGTLV